MPDLDVSRLPDGRLFWALSPGIWRVLSDGGWVEPEGSLNLAAIIEAKPLSKDEIADLISKGILPQ